MGVFNEFRFSTEVADGLSLLSVSAPDRPSWAAAILPASGSGVASGQRVHSQNLRQGVFSTPSSGLVHLSGAGHPHHPKAWSRWAQAHLAMSELRPRSPDHRPVVLGGQLFYLFHEPTWGALGAQRRRAPEGTERAQLRLSLSRSMVK